MELIESKTSDLTPEERDSLKNYIENGCPGLTTINDTKTFKWFELYMSGKSYTEIAQITKDRKDLIVYVSYKTDWHNKKMGYYDSISRSLVTKVAQAKTDSVNTVAAIVTGMNKYFGEKFNEYLSTNNKEVIEGIDTKLLEKYYKSLEILDKLFNPEDPEIKKNRAATVNINLGSDSNATVKQVDDSTIQVDQNSANMITSSQILMALAQIKKNQEKN